MKNQTTIIRNPISKLLALAAGLSLTFATPFTANAAVFAKFDGIDGESKDARHEKWIDVLSVDWGLRLPGNGITGQTRRRGTVIVEDLVLTFEYEKAAPKLQEACLRGQNIPKLEIELTASFGGAQATYLRYEMKNVYITATKFKVGTSQTGADPIPTEQISLNFEEIKVTYTEYDDDGGKKGDVEFSWRAEQGE